MTKPWITDAAERIEGEQLTDVATVTRLDAAASVNPTTGIVTRGSQVIANDVACLVRLARPGRDMTIGDDRQTVATHVVSLPLTVGIVQEGDQITIDDSPNLDLVNAIFDVIGPAEATHRVRRMVLCRHVSPDPQR